MLCIIGCAEYLSAVMCVTYVLSDISQLNTLFELVQQMLSAQQQRHQLDAAELNL